MIKSQAVRNKYDKSPTARIAARMADSAARVCLGVLNAVAVGWALAAVGIAWGALGYILGAHGHATALALGQPFGFLFSLVATM